MLNAPTEISRMLARSALVLCVVAVCWRSEAGGHVSHSPTPRDGTAHAQPESKSKPSSDPTLTSQSVEDALQEQRSRKSGSGTIPPIQPSPGQRAIPAVSLTAIPTDRSGIAPQRMLQEGAFFSARRGTLVKTPSGRIVFVPSQGEGEDVSRLAPVVLMQNQSLMLLQSAVAVFDPPPTATVSGQVFVYHGRQYLMLSVFSLDSSPQADAPKVTPIPRSTKPSGSEPTAKGDPSGAPSAETVDEFIKQLETNRATSRAMDRDRVVAGASGDSSTTVVRRDAGASDANAQGSLAAEGTMLTSRRGRLSRVGLMNELAFTFDNDPNSPALMPMRLLPCRLLQSLESLAGSRGDSLVLRVSGRVTVFEGNNYLLPIMYQVLQTGEITPLQ